MSGSWYNYGDTLSQNAYHYDNYATDTDFYMPVQNVISSQPRSVISNGTIAPQQLDRDPIQYSQNRAYQLSPSRRHGSASSSSSGNWSSDPSPAIVASRTDRYERQTTYPDRKDNHYEIEIKSSTPKPRYYCDIVGCDDGNGRPCSVSRKADLKRHIESVHGSPIIECKYKKCSRKGDQGFCRPDHYREHLRGYHNETVSDKPVRK